jgi:hypothetical protein
MAETQSASTIMKEAFTNNTFNLKSVENSIQSGIENSFHYLKGLQRAYIDICRYTFSNEDFYTNEEKVLAILLQKDFVESGNRRLYHESKFYTNTITLDDMISNRDIFSYIPIILVDGKSITGYTIQCKLDGNTEIAFPFITIPKLFLSETHKVEIVCLKNMDYTLFKTNKYVLDKYSRKLPKSVTGLNLTSSNGVMITIQKSTEDYGTNLVAASIDSNGNLVISTSSKEVASLISTNGELLISVFSSPNLYEVSGNKYIGTRIDNQKTSFLIVIEPSADETFAMPIPHQNLIILSRDLTTGDMTYENNATVTLHYPNIYEIEVPGKTDNYHSFKIFYFYHKMNDYLK